MKKKAVVAAGHEAVTGAAALILEAGGNAFDAVVAAGFAGTVAEQMLTSLGGGGFALARTADQQEIFFDFFVDTPGLGLETSQLEPHFYPIKVEFGGSDQEFNIGLGSVAVPGTLKGLLHIHERLGRMPLSEVIEPAVILAEGHRINAFQAEFIRLLRPILTMTAPGRTLYEPDGALLRAGATLEVPELAAFLRQLAEDKGKEFYCGEIAHLIDQEMRNGDGLLTAEDLGAYRVIERKPLRVPYHGHTLLTAPDLGGSLVGLSLFLQEKIGEVAGSLEQWGSPEYLLRTLGLMQEVERLRKQGVDSPQTLADFIAGRDSEASVGRMRRFSRGTTHISVADSRGNIASMTCSNGEGSGYFVPGTGIMLNNMMGEDDLHPDGFHAEPPGQRVRSMMSPSALLYENEVKLVFGSGGSKRIRTALSQVLTQYVDFKRDLVEAVQAPRLHWDDDGGVLQIEPGIDAQAIAAVQKQVPINLWDDRNVYFGGVHAVMPGVGGVGDPRRGGSVAVVEL
ncbi:MAG: gamma-glutamyltransferase [Candidatus Electrothrix sp. GW3-4]|uniref:gamma-glutamyltransferase family protein n=1 Tax=Candidatus Electrothrix sp. GW3-4 TaxID=3126740 RepID=UPI0030D130DF